jgi:hypothetical protein
LEGFLQFLLAVNAGGAFERGRLLLRICLFRDSESFQQDICFLVLALVSVKALVLAKLEKLALET